jgi:hypothetical protein
MRTFRKGCASSNKLRTFGRASALGYPLAGAVPLLRQVVLALASASIALRGVETNPERSRARRIARRRG